MSIRFATADDAASLLAIYAQYIDTAITFECTLPSEEEFAHRILEISSEYPYLVSEEDGRIVGYAYAHRLKEREAYQWDAELSVYLDRSFTSKGLGKRLYGLVIDILKLQGIKTVYGVVVVPNEKSERLHESLGFSRIGVYHNTGYKCGKWHDVVWYDKQIAPYDDEPEPIVPIGRIAVDEKINFGRCE